MKMLANFNTDDNKLGSKQKVVFGLSTKEMNQDYYVNIRPMLSFMWKSGNHEFWHYLKTRIKKQTTQNNIFVLEKITFWPTMA
jgi:hypothetical protein